MPVATPLAFVTAAGCVIVFPVPVDVRFTEAPATGFPLASSAVTVTVLVATPAVMLVGAATTVESAADTVPDTTVTVAVGVTAVPPIVAEMTFAPITVDAMVPVTTPLALVTATGWVTVLPPPVAERTTAKPEIGLLFASRAVTEIVLVAVPATIDGGAATTSDCAAETVPTVTVTAAVGVRAVRFAVAEIVFAAATVDEIVPVATPLAFVTLAGCVRVLPVPVALSTTLAAGITLLNASRTVTVIVLVAAPATMLAGAAVIVESVAETAAGMTVTTAVCVTGVTPMVAESVFACATVDAIVPVATPLAFVTAAGCVSVLFVPVAASSTVAPWIGLPFASRAVTVIVLVAAPATIEVGATMTVDCAAETPPTLTVKGALVAPTRVPEVPANV